MRIVGLSLIHDAIRAQPPAAPLLSAFHALVGAARWTGPADIAAALPASRRDAAGRWHLTLGKPALVLVWRVNFAAGLVVLDAIGPASTDAEAESWSR